MKLPQSIGPLHFIGIGGIGMSGIAEVLINLGYKVQGTDIADNYNVKRLRQIGAKITIGHKADNLGDAEVVVVSSAVKRDNPELVAARERHIPVVRRAEMLAELMRLRSCVAIGGTHGKTTTTSLVAALLEAGGFDPTFINGGIVNAYGTNAKLGAGKWMVVEADESDGTFVKLPADVVVVTNIDPEHLDHYGDFEIAKRAYIQYVENIPFYGFAVMCTDHPVVQQLAAKIIDKRVVTYGVNPQADVRLFDLGNEGIRTMFEVAITDRKKDTVRTISNLSIPMPGHHNALNATAAIAVAAQLGISDNDIRKGLASFAGVKRRFTHVGTWNKVTIIDDYGHHPVEISAVLKAARDVTKDAKVIAVVQPHRYTRLLSLFNQFCTCFNDADIVIVADTYPAGEQPIEGAMREDLVQGLKAHGHRNVMPLIMPEDLAPLIKSIAEPGDIVVCRGAGSITQWAQALPGELASRAA
jgi:UDP-N-acetylmuramate--alanine ligase